MYVYIIHSIMFEHHICQRPYWLSGTVRSTSPGCHEVSRKIAELVIYLHWSNLIKKWTMPNTSENLTSERPRLVDRTVNANTRYRWMKYFNTAMVMGTSGDIFFAGDFFFKFLRLCWDKASRWAYQNSMSCYQVLPAYITMQETA